MIGQRFYYEQWFRRDHWWTCFGVAIDLWDDAAIQSMLWNAPCGSPESAIVWC